MRYDIVCIRDEDFVSLRCRSGYDAAMEKIMLELTRDDFRELLLLASIGDRIRGSVMDVTADEEGAVHDIHDRVIDALYEVALENALPEVKPHEDHIDPERWFEDDQIRILKEYEDDVFWEELEIRLSKRDFDRAKEPLPIGTYREKYAHETTSYGVDRLFIDENAPVSDMRDAL